MRDNLDELIYIINSELKEIKVSEKLKLKTLEKLDENSRSSLHKAFIPIILTTVACLFMGFIIYPTYNKNNLISNTVITMNTSDKDIKALKEPYMDATMTKDKADTKEDKPNGIVEENDKVVNKNVKKPQQEKETIILNEKLIIPFKNESSMLSNKNDKNIIVATNKDVIDSGKLIKEDTKDNSLELPKENELQPIEGNKMRTLSLQEARNVFGDNIKIPFYIPKDFVMEKILVPEISKNSYILYEIIYSNNSQYFKITEYKNDSDELNKNSSIESKVDEEYIMIININMTPIKYILKPSTDNSELPYVKLFWEDGGRRYSVDGNAPWAELINIVYYILF